ncbi:MAG TPA: protein-L-isoaspartate(D-aspartate) O-methyltransferase [Candidatus Angelobacter sp.]|jgi:protein-L-isoaspartate(D-aspartate) O-methyltransferase|nr:protein-L-isoaspartate(D-aspartate) O-methyltransferase [Candidatus Angelobacter sp.]
MSGNGTQPFAAERWSMVESQLRQRGICDERLLAAMNKVPRHEFVNQQNWNEAYADHPIPIAEQQTTSQPYMIAAMIQAAQIKPQDRILEIGAGSGYQTALLAELANQVFAVERYASLAEAAQRTLDRLGYRNTKIFTGDGSLGLPHAAPFDAIIVSAAAPRIPQALAEQLAIGGRLLIPVGGSDQQILQLVQRNADGTSVRTLEGCRFVRLIGEQGFAA